MPQPKLLSKPWASDGLKNNIPAERNGGLAQEAATYAEGFPNITMTPISVGGKPPSGKDMNGVLYEISAHTVWQNQGGRYRFDQSFCDTIGGYPKGAVLLNDKGDAEYISLVEQNRINFNTESNNKAWAVLSRTSDYPELAALNALLTGYTANSYCPSGQIGLFAMDYAPAGWLKANGAAVSRTLYANLFAAIGTRFGAGDGYSTFNLPDLRGEFPRFWDDGRGIDLGRVFGSVQSDNTRRHIHGTGMMSDTDDAVLISQEWGGSLPRDAQFATIQINGVLDSLLENRYDNPAHRRNNIFRRPLGTAENEALPDARSETRPRNIALLACIKY